VTSPRQLEANRANARASTGPKTQAGRARAALNALRHGLAVSVFGDIVWGPQVEVLARRIAGERADAELLEAASAVATVQMELNRMHTHRRRAIEQAVADYERGGRIAAMRASKSLEAIEQHVQRVEILVGMASPFIAVQPSGNTSVPIAADSVPLRQNFGSRHNWRRQSATRRTSRSSAPIEV
jgi:hypothetical protein